MPVSFSIADSSEGARKVVIRVSGDLDADTGRAVRARLGQAQRRARSDVILDLTGVVSIDSVAPISLVNGAKAMNEFGKLRLSAVFELTPTGASTARTPASATSPWPWTVERAIAASRQKRRALP